MVELLLMDQNLAESPALKYTFLEKAANTWLQGSIVPTLATPSQLQTVFKLIKAEYDGKLGVALLEGGHGNDVTMQSLSEDEEMKEDTMEEIPLLKRMSSEMQALPYSRVTALVKGVQLLQTMVKKS